MRSLLIAAVVAVAPTVAPWASAQNATIKVQLFAELMPSEVTVVPQEGTLSVFADPRQEPLATVSAPDTLVVRRGAVDLSATTGELSINLTDLYVEAGPSQPFVIESRHPEDRRASRRLIGSLHISNDAGRARLRIVNEVDLETYVAAVVGKEYDLDDGEGARAMAVVARTFAVRASLEGDGTATDGLASQVYRGMDAITEASLAAAESTRGQILTYEGAPIVAVYSASNGGHSAGNADVWSGRPLPYLRAKRDRYDSAASPHSDWEFEAPASEVHALLESKLGSQVEKVAIAARTGDGRVQTVKVRTTDGSTEELSGNDFRLIMSRKYGASSLRSTRFDLKLKGDSYAFSGSGFGHGVGLSQWGAHEMSSRGYNYQEILRQYYPGTKLTTIDALSSSPAAAFAADLRPAIRSARDDNHQRSSIDSRPATQLIGWTGTTAERVDDRSAVSRRPGW